MTKLNSPADLSVHRVPTVHFVCTGNICRSPFAERLLAVRLPDVMASSSGIHALEGSRMDESMADELAGRGGSASRFHARQVCAEYLQADIILTMSRRQRDYLLEEFPGAVRRIGQFGDVSDLVALSHDRPEAAFRDLVAEWARSVPSVPRDVPDPYRRGRDAAAHSAAILSDLTDLLAPVLKGAALRP